jgi:hypothetical protein
VLRSGSTSSLIVGWVAVWQPVSGEEGQDVGAGRLEVCRDGGELAVEGVEDPVELGVHGPAITRRRVGR